jgi:hypothetical protein
VAREQPRDTCVRSSVYFFFSRDASSLINMPKKPVEDETGAAGPASATDPNLNAKRKSLLNSLKGYAKAVSAKSETNHGSIEHGAEMQARTAESCETESDLWPVCGVGSHSAKEAGQPGT